MMHYNPNLGGMDGAPENESTARRELVDELRMNNIFESVNPTPGASRSDSTDRKGETVSDETTVRNPSTPPKIPQRTHSPTPIPTPTPDLPQTPGVFFLGLSPRLKRETKDSDEGPRQAATFRWQLKASPSEVWVCVYSGSVSAGEYEVFEAVRSDSESDCIIVAGSRTF